MVSLPPQTPLVQTLESLPDEQRQILAPSLYVADYFLSRMGEALWETFAKEFPSKVDYPVDLSTPAIKQAFLTGVKTGFFNAMNARIELAKK